MTLAMAAYTINDACMKLLGDHLPIGQVLFLRGGVTSVLIAVWVVWRGAWRIRLSAADWGRVGLRTLAEAGAAFFFISALFHMPLANASAVLQALPLTVALAGALFLGEPLGWRRLTAIMIGFLGVLLIVKPGPDGFDGYTLYAVCAVAAITLRDLATRRLGGTVPTATVVLFATLSGAFLGAGLSPGETWVAVSPSSMMLLAASVAFILIAYVLSVMVMRIGDIGVIAPFRYTGLLWALVLGFLAFGDWPSMLTLLGAGVVVATGIFTYYRERVVAQS
jgi:S-adenosylmethionine uptake transporter